VEIPEHFHVRLLWKSVDQPATGSERGVIKVLEENTSFISIQPVIRYPREARPGRAYLMTVDLRVPETAFSWPYEEEELPVYCFVDTSTLFDSEPLGDSTIMLHRFGGTYGPAEFLLITTDNPQEADIKITLTSMYGKPIKVIVLSDVRVVNEEAESTTRLKVTSNTKPLLIPTPTLAPNQRSDSAVDKPARKFPSTRDLPGIRVPINLTTSKIVVAVAQVAGPLPNGKFKAVVNDRETLAWKSLDDMRTRLEKAYAILDTLSVSSLKPDIVVFPEYAFPVQKALGELQVRADKYNFIIVGGADSIWQPNSTDIFNQSPIVIPGHEQPVWVTKRLVSQWEEGLVDEPGEINQPLLTWAVNGSVFWISTRISLDFSLALEEFRLGGGLFIVPMCSPDVLSFLGWADALLRFKGGTATVLCNCVGGETKGQSAVVAVNPGGKPFQAALELSRTKEQVSVVEIDLQHLAPPRKTSPTNRFPLGRSFRYDLETMLGGIHLQAEAIGADGGVAKRGVINPAIFSAVLGKTMRIAFLNVLNYAEVETKLEGKDYEALAILGGSDLMVTHLADDRYDMIFDVTQAISWIGIRGETVTGQDLNGFDEDDFPHFRVDTYYKLMGVPVSETDRGIFRSRDQYFPSFTEIEKVFKLGQNWEHPDVTDEERTRFLHNRLILDVTPLIPGDINAVMTIRLQHHRTENKAYLLAKFQTVVLPELIANDQVTSVLGGSSPGLGIDYVVRLSCDIGTISRLQYQLHDLARSERIIVDTTTYIVHKKLSRLSLPKAILVTKLSRDKRYRDRRIMPHLMNDERVRLTYQPEREQLEFIDLFRPVDEALDKIEYLRLGDDKKNILLRRLTSGLFNKDFDLLREVHDPLQTRVEKTLSAFIRNEIGEKEFEELKAEVNVPSQKTKTQLNYSEKIKITVRHIEETENESLDRLTSVKGLISTSQVRNVFAHNEFERITVKQFTETVVNYCHFLYGWDEGPKKLP
jgi:predicted amidohydrolase